MATTTNFGWETPDDTDLVKDGALAMRTLGNAIDTSLVDLKGGTTGQILSKTSNTDMDFTWVNNDQGDITGITATTPLTGGGTSGAVTVGIQDASTTQKGAVQLENSTSSTSTTTAAVPASVKSAYDLANAAIPKSLVDAAGDIIYATANDTVARLALGTAGQVLTVNSGATAPEWKAASSGSYTLLYTVTMSGASNISQTTDFTGYRAAVVEYENVTCGSTWNLETRINASTTLLYAQTLSNNTTALVNVSGSSFFQEGSGGAQKASTRTDAVLNINNPASTAAYKAVDYQSTYTRNAAGDPLWSLTTKGFFRSASAITSIVFDSNSGNFTGGTVRIYGVK
jgi:hypothetical protein